MNLQTMWSGKKGAKTQFTNIKMRDGITIDSIDIQKIMVIYNFIPLDSMT